MKKIVLAFLLISVISCKNNQENNADSVKEPTVEKNKELVFKMGFKTNVEDVFKISLNNIQVDELQKKNIQVIEKVSPSTGFESIVANFGPENISKNFVISLGNKEEKKIDLNGIEISYGDQAILVSKGNFNKYFNINKFVKLDPENFSLTTTKVDGKHNPLIIAKRKLIQELENKPSNKK